MSPRIEANSEVLRRVPQAVLVCVLSLVLGVVGLAPASAKGGEEGLGLRLELFPKTLIVGQKGTLTLSLKDATGEPRRAQRDLDIQLQAQPGGLLETSSVRLRSGFSRVEVTLSPKRSDTWSIQASTRGFFSARVLVVAVAAQRADRGQASPDRPTAGGFAVVNTSLEEIAATQELLVRQKGIQPDLAAKVLELEPNVAVSEETTPRGGDVPGDEPVTEPGRLHLELARTIVHRGADGLFRGILHAVWREGDEPSPRQSDLPLQFLFIPSGGDHRLEPSQAVLRTSETSTRLEVHSATEGEVQVVAIYDGFVSDPSILDFRPAKPKQLLFSSDFYSLRSLGSTQLEVSVRLLDANGALAATDKAREITLTMRGSDGERSQTLEIPAGDFQASAVFEVSRFGRYELEAIDVGLDSAKAQVRLRFDFFLLLIGLLGGMLGSLTRLLFQRHHDWKKDLKRALVLGVVAALLAVPLALFGLLSALSSVFPEGLLEALSALPSENHLAMFFIGLVAGLALEPLLAFFTSLRSQGTQDTGET